MISGSNYTNVSEKGCLAFPTLYLIGLHPKHGNHQNEESML
jgi:hypothetical protein